MNTLKFSAAVLVIAFMPILAAGQQQQEEPKKGGIGGFLRGLGDRVKEKAAGNLPTDPGAGVKHPTLGETELAGFFDKYPQPGGGKPLVQWPRVAVMMEAAPQWHLQIWDRVRDNTSNLPGGGCWQFTAKVWMSEADSRDVPVFYKCTGEGLHSFSSTQYIMWSGRLDNQLRPEGRAGTTGAERTMGPNPPDTPLPNTLPYRRASFGSTYSGYAIQEIVRAMNLDYDTADDRRLWFTVAPHLEPKQ